MKIERHADRCEELYGVRGEDIHEWIDQYFDHERFKRKFRAWLFEGWNPYDHRKRLHHKEALPLAVEKFSGKYPEDIIEKIFLQHLRDDYGGYEPSVSDYKDPAFLKKYHHFF